MRAEPRLDGEIPAVITKVWIKISGFTPERLALLAMAWGTEPDLHSLWSHANAQAVDAFRAGDAPARDAVWIKLLACVESVGTEAP